MAALKAKCVDLGVQFVEGEVVSFQKDIPTDNRPIVFDQILKGSNVRFHLLFNIFYLKHRLNTNSDVSKTVFLKNQ